MIDISKINIGDKVHYIPFEGCDKKQIENGMVKRVPDHTNISVFVVYHCNGEWDDFRNYTAALTNIADLELGWVHE
jgi:hypothetical protein